MRPVVMSLKAFLVVSRVNASPGKTQAELSCKNLIKLVRLENGSLWFQLIHSSAANNGHKVFWDIENSARFAMMMHVQLTCH